MDSGQKIYPASPHKIKKSREEGQVPKSTDLIALIVLFVSISYIYISRNKILNLMNKVLIMLSVDIHKEFNLSMFGEYIKTLVLTATPLFLCIIVGAILINYFQVGLVLSPKALMPKLNRINPIEGFKRMFSKDVFVELAKSIVKVVGVIYIAYNEVADITKGITKSYTENMPFAWDMVFGNIFSVSMKICMLLLVLSILDYMYKRFKFFNDLKMTREEMIREQKDFGGNPLIKQKQREFARTLTKRQVQAVKEATVLVVNPTHYAVALKFDPKTHPVPVVLFKGVDEIALTAKKIAKENKVPIIENKPLARGLYAKVDEGKTIPKEFYQSVSTVISQIMIMDKKLNRKLR